MGGRTNDSAAFVMGVARHRRSVCRWCPALTAMTFLSACGTDALSFDSTLDEGGTVTEVLPELPAPSDGGSKSREAAATLAYVDGSVDQALPQLPPTSGTEEEGATAVSTTDTSDVGASDGALPGPVAFLSFDEGTGPAAHDGSGHGHDAPVGDDAKWDDGVAGSAVSLGGESSLAPSGLAIDVTQPFSVSAWCNIDRKTGQNQTLVSADGNQVSAFYLQLSNQLEPRFGLPSKDSTSVGWRGFTSPSSVSLQRWTHLVGRYDGQQLALFVDGALAGTDAYHVTWGTAGKVRLGRGKYQGEAADWMRGSLDQVRVYDRALSAQEIAALFQQKM